MKKRVFQVGDIVVQNVKKLPVLKPHNRLKLRPEVGTIIKTYNVNNNVHYSIQWSDNSIVEYDNANLMMFLANEVFCYYPVK